MAWLFYLTFLELLRKVQHEQFLKKCCITHFCGDIGETILWKNTKIINLILKVIQNVLDTLTELLYLYFPLFYVKNDT